jgi:hypothetical protein
MWLVASALSWQAKQAVAIGEFTRVVGAAFTRAPVAAL